MADRSVAQWDKDDCDNLGSSKSTCWGRDEVCLARPIELCRNAAPRQSCAIPKDDPATFAMMCAADTIGVFQIEIRAQMATLPRMNRKTFMTWPLRSNHSAGPIKGIK